MKNFDDDLRVLLVVAGRLAVINILETLLAEVERLAATRALPAPDAGGRHD